ncbi:MAG: DUF4159 domain-containing protein [Gemmatimonadota bacterium]|nr:DUF4159 domain-containing protein [Gemmatimonadota bacterium]
MKNGLGVVVAGGMLTGILAALLAGPPAPTGRDGPDEPHLAAPAPAPVPPPRATRFVAPLPANVAADAAAALSPPQRPPPEWHEFYFTRAAYGSYGWGRRSWATDYPKSDRQFLTVLQRLTNLDAFSWENAILLTDENIRRYPFLYALEVGYMSLSAGEIEGLRDYLKAGGFLVIDDFWGTREWAQFEYQMSLVFPQHPIIDLELDHPVFNTFYDIDEILQVPAYGRYWRGRTSERDGYVPYVKGILDDDGRLMVIINWNTDLGDAWEWAERPDYPVQYSTFAFQMGVNMIIYAMSH